MASQGFVPPVQRVDYQGSCLERATGRYSAAGPVLPEKVVTSNEQIDRCHLARHYEVIDELQLAQQRPRIGHGH